MKSELFVLLLFLEIQFELEMLTLDAFYNGDWILGLVGRITITHQYLSCLAVCSGWL